MAAAAAVHGGGIGCYRVVRELLQSGAELLQSGAGVVTEW